MKTHIQMSSTLKWVLVAAVIEMTLVAAGVATWRWQSLPDPGAPVSTQWVVATFSAFFMPAVIALAAWLAARKVARKGLTVAADTRRYNEVTLMACAALAVGVQAWLACLALSLIPRDAIQIRALEALTGVFFMVTANFAAKTSPPTGARAPDPAAWTRAMLRIGWVGVATGLVILIAAITVEINQMVWVIFAASGVYVAAAWQQRRALHRKSA